MEIRAPHLIKVPASKCAVFKPGFQNAIRLSGHLVVTLSQTPVGGWTLCVRPAELYVAIDIPVAAKHSPRRSTAQAILASLLAKATTATLR
jgi:hypothetical protein